MRRFPVLLVAAVAALSPVPAAFAHEPGPAEDTSQGCPPPEVVQRYHPDRFTVSVTLLATGCPARENRAFSMTAWLSRTEGQVTESEGQVVGCGPFASAESTKRTQDRLYVCELDMARGHPSPDAAWYDVVVRYPGADGEETLEGRSFCTTGDDGAYCTEDDAR